MRMRESSTSVWSKTRDTAIRRLFLDRSVGFWLDQLAPFETPGKLRARVVSIVQETLDTRTFVLRPNSRWLGHRAGQYTAVEVEVNGVRLRRCYSISSAPKASLVSITVKRVPGGRVSNWLHDELRVGNLVGLSPAAGEFALPEQAPKRVLLLSGGSGVTPVMSMLRDLATRDAVDDVVFIHYARCRGEVIFGDDLVEFAEHHPGLKLILCCDDDDSATPGFDEARFRELVPDFAERATFLCGPPPLMDRVERLWTASGADEQLARESFVAPSSSSAKVEPGKSVDVFLTRSGRELSTTGSGTLLEQLERAGEQPAHGCRIGICHSCKCQKKSGTVQNLLTGELSTEPDQEIQLCISLARSDLDLDL